MTSEIDAPEDTLDPGAEGSAGAGPPGLGLVRSADQAARSRAAAFNRLVDSTHAEADLMERLTGKPASDADLGAIALRRLRSTNGARPWNFGAAVPSESGPGGSTAGAASGFDAGAQETGAASPFGLAPPSWATPGAHGLDDAGGSLSFPPDAARRAIVDEQRRAVGLAPVDLGRSVDGLADIFDPSLSVPPAGPAQPGGAAAWDKDDDPDMRLVASTIDPKKMGQRDIAISIYQTARKLGATPAEAQWLVSAANKEASLKLNSHTDTHFGLFQYGRAEWREHHGGKNIYDLESQVRFALEDLQKNVKVLGGDPDIARKKVYVLHQQGPAGGPALINAPPGATAAAARGSVSVIRDNLPDRLKPLAATISAQAFLQELYASFDRKQDEALGIMRSTPKPPRAPSGVKGSARRARVRQRGG